jgi:hypothetical protein
MPHPPDVQPDLPDPPPSDAEGQPFDHQPDEQLLDASSLSTVLDMLAVIDCAEDLALLEYLTPPQKRQVWDATPEEIKLNLKQIRLAASSSPKASGSLASGNSASGSLASGNLASETSLETPELPNYLQETRPTSAIQTGDRVILLAKPQLTATEMNSIWEVIKVEADQVYVRAAGVSDRQYPLSWIVRYPH